MEENELIPVDNNNAVEYTDDNIRHLSDMEHVRTRPGMYIGTTGSKGLHHLLWEIVDNAVDEASNGYADKVEADDLNDFSSQLFSWFITKEPALTETLKTGRKLDDDTRAALHAALTAFAEAL